MGQLQLLHTAADPASLSAAAALDTWKWYSIAFPNLVICQYLRCWNSGTARLLQQIFFYWNMRTHPESWTHNTDWYSVFHPTVSLSDHESKWMYWNVRKIFLIVSLDPPYKRVVYNFPLSPTLLLSLSEDKSEFGEISKPNFWVQVSSEED